MLLETAWKRVENSHEKKGEPLPFRAGFSQVLVVHTAAGGHEDLVHSTVTPALPTHCNNDQIKKEQ